MDNTIQEIHAIIKWLQQNGESQDISGICIKLNELAIHSFWFAEQVSEAYSSMNSLEHDYKTSVAKEISNSTLSFAKAEPLAELNNAGKKREFVEYKNLYNKLRSMVDRIDRILDHERQRVSLVKQLDLKHG